MLKILLVNAGPDQPLRTFEVTTDYDALFQVANELLTANDIYEYALHLAEEDPYQSGFLHSMISMMLLPRLSFYLLSTTSHKVGEVFDLAQNSSVFRASFDYVTWDKVSWNKQDFDHGHDNWL